MNVGVKAARLTINVPDALRDVVVRLAGVLSESMVHPDDYPNRRSRHDQSHQNEIPDDDVERRQQTSTRGGFLRSSHDHFPFALVERSRELDVSVGMMVRLVEKVVSVTLTESGQPVEGRKRHPRQLPAHEKKFKTRTGP